MRRWSAFAAGRNGDGKGPPCRFFSTYESADLPRPGPKWLPWKPHQQNRLAFEPSGMTRMEVIDLTDSEKARRVHWLATIRGGGKMGLGS